MFLAGVCCLMLFDVVVVVVVVVGGGGGVGDGVLVLGLGSVCLLYTSPSPRDKRQSRMPSSA